MVTAARQASRKHVTQHVAAVCFLGLIWDQIMEIVTKKDAKESGLKRYFTGRPCKYGHHAERYVVNSMCVECSRAWGRHQYQKPDVRERVLERQKLYRQNPKNAEHTKQRMASYYQKPNVKRRKRKKYLEMKNDPERYQHMLEKQRIRRMTDEDKAKRRAWKRKYDPVKYHGDPEYKLRVLLRVRLKDAIKNNRYSESAIDLLGCSVAQAREHLETMFVDGMGWGNHGEWHIDHIVPVSAFDLSTVEGRRSAFHYSNLQPLWAADNIRKGNKLIA